VEFQGTAGRSYLIRLGSSPGAPGGSGTFSIVQSFEEREFTAAGAANREAVGNLDGDTDGTVDVVIVIPTGGAGSGVTVGDYDSDGLLDVAVANAGSNDVWVFLNTGDGMASFAEPIIVKDVGTEPRSIASGDFTGDGTIDLMVANAGGEGEVVLLRNDEGDGSFLIRLPIPVRGRPLGVDPEDIDRDESALDALVANNQSGSVSALVNEGGGVFDQPPGSPFGVGAGPVDLTTGDFDGDGLSDVATSNSDEATLSLLLGVGDGTFTSAGALAVGQFPESVHAVDLDNDGDPDLAVVAEDPDLGEVVQVLENQGDGMGGRVSFGAPESIVIEAEPNFVLSGDFDADGVEDLVTVNDENGGAGGSVTVLLNVSTALLCGPDIDGSGGVGVDDLLALILAWGTADPAADIDGSGVVDVDDLLLLILAWGPCA
jgi:hypothetical protein